VNFLESNSKKRFARHDHICRLFLACVDEGEGSKRSARERGVALKRPQNVASGNARRPGIYTAPSPTLKGLHALLCTLCVRLFQGRLSLWGMVRGRCPRLPYASPSGIACAESAMKAADPACALRSRASSRRGVCFRSSFATADSSSLRSSEWQAGGFVPIGTAQTDFHVVGFCEGKFKRRLKTT